MPGGAWSHPPMNKKLNKSQSVQPYDQTFLTDIAHITNGSLYANQSMEMAAMAQSLNMKRTSPKLFCLAV